jgi:hypothetical protein
MMMLPVGRRYRRRRIMRGTMALLLVGGAAYKISQSQAQQIQQQTGKAPEDLSKEQLEQAMDDLGIEEQELTPDDVAAIDAEAEDAPQAAAPAPKPAPAPATPTASAAPAQPDYIEELKRLAGLKDAGVITDEEFQAKKAKLMGL